MTLVQRGGSARSFRVDGTTIGDLLPIIRANLNAKSFVMTDAASWYKNLKARQSVMKAKKKQSDEQIAAFRKAARDLGCDENEGRFQEALRRYEKLPTQSHMLLGGQQSPRSPKNETLLPPCS